MRSPLQQKLRAVMWRCGVNLLLQSLAVSISFAGLLASLAVVAWRLLALPLVNPYAVVILVAATVTASIILWLLRLPTEMQAALLIDERLKLKDYFSTALALSGQDDVFSQAAVSQAQDKARQINLKSHFPLRPTRRWLLSLAVWALACGLSFIPSMDLLHRQADATQDLQAQQAKSEIKQNLESVKAVVNQLGDKSLANELEKLKELSAATQPAGELKRQAIRKLTDLSEQIRQLQTTPSMQASAEMGQMLKQLRSTAGGLSSELSTALARGDFANANKMLKQLQQQMQGGKLTAEQQKALSKQLADLSNQLQEIARAKKQLQNELQKMGLDPNLAGATPQQLADAMKKAGASEKQISDMMAKAQAAQQAASECSQLGQCANSASGSGGQPSESGMQQLSDQLSQLEAMQQELASSQASLEEIARAVESMGGGQGGSGLGEGGEGSGQWKEGLAQNEGNGTGGPGRGRGPRDSDTSGEVDYQKTKLKNQQKQGPIIASYYFKGEQLKGEARLELKQAAQAAKDHAAEAISENQIPKRYESSVKKYFNQLEQDTASDGDF